MDSEYLGLLGGYLLGSIPFGLLVAKTTGSPDPRLHGSKNIGFTNVLRVCGKKAGVLTLLGDMGKGFIVVVLAKLSGYSWDWILMTGLAVILGHVFSLFLSFHGGKGVATALGVISGIHWPIGLSLIGVWLGSVFLFKYSSAGALAAFGVFPILVLLVSGDRSFFLFSLCVLGLVIYCHRSNIGRLYRGAEPRIGNIRS